MILAPTLLLNTGSGAAIARPTFSRDFAGEKTLNNGTGPAITFTRASDATYFDADGTLQTASNDAPRFDHDPATGASRGLLIEEQRTNRLLTSAIGPSGTNWAATGTSTQTYGQSDPFGGANAVLFEDTDATSVSYLRQVVSITSSNSTYTASWFAKAGTSGKAYIRLACTGGTAEFGTAVFDFSAKTFSTVNDVSGAEYIDVGGGWFRLSAKITDNATGNTNFDFRIGATDVTVSDTGSVYLWGAQLEAGGFPTSYIPTTGATATRSADSAFVTPIASFYNQAEGTLFAEASFSAVGANSNRAVFAASDNSVDNRNYILFDNAQQFIATNASAAQASIDAGTITTSGSKVAAAYKQDDFAASLNGAAAVTDTLGTPALALTHLTIGRRFSTDSSQVILNGCIAKLAYWPKRLTNTLLEQLTT